MNFPNRTNSKKNKIVNNDFSNLPRNNGTSEPAEIRNNEHYPNLTHQELNIAYEYLLKPTKKQKLKKKKHNLNYWCMFF